MLRNDADLGATATPEAVPGIARTFEIMVMSHDRHHYHHQPHMGISKLAGCMGIDAHTGTEEIMRFPILHHIRVVSATPRLLRGISQDLDLSIGDCSCIVKSILQELPVPKLPYKNNIV